MSGAKEYCLNCGIPLEEWEWSGRGYCEACEESLEESGEEESEGTGVVFCIPGEPYGDQGEMLPSCASIFSLYSVLHDYYEGLVDILPLGEIGPESLCQRGSDGEPLSKFDSSVEFLTYEEWRLRQRGS